MSTRVKICGLTRAEDAEAAAQAGADYLGLVFAPGSPRRVDVAAVQGWLSGVRGLSEVVGVFRDQEVDEVLAVAESLDLDLVQLHGSESGSGWRRLPLRLLEARVVEDGRVPPARFAGAAWAHLLDAGAGSGRSFDWELARELARSERLFLAGGLRPENVAEAVRLVRPFAVDVSSGIETSPGVKDAGRIRAFLRAVKEAESA